MCAQRSIDRKVTLPQYFARGTRGANTPMELTKWSNHLPLPRAGMGAETRFDAEWSGVRNVTQRGGHRIKVALRPRCFYRKITPACWTSSICCARQPAYQRLLAVSDQGRELGPIDEPIWAGLNRRCSEFGRPTGFSGCSPRIRGHYYGPVAEQGTCQVATGVVTPDLVLGREP